MSPEVFEKGLERALAMPESIRVNLCGLGEPLLNRHVPDFIRQVRGAGVECGMSSNGSLLDEKKAAAVLEAGVGRVFLNVGDRDEDYEEVYKLPFERTLANVERFVAMAGDDCEVYLVLVNHRRDPEHTEDMRRFWQERGVTRFQEFDIINRVARSSWTRCSTSRCPSSPRRGRCWPRVAVTPCARCPSPPCSSATTASTTCAARTGGSRRRWAACSTPT